MRPVEWVCQRCGEPSRSMAAAYRHAHEQKHARIGMSPEELEMSSTICAGSAK